LLVQSFHPAKVASVLVRCSRCVVSHFLDFAVFLQRVLPRLSTKVSVDPLFEFHLRVELRPVKPSRLLSQDSTSHGLFFPSAHKDSKVHWPRALPARYVPSSGFGYPLDGLLPSNPCRFCFAPAALLGFTLRSLPLSRGIRVSPPERTHLPFNQALFPTSTTLGRPAWPRFPGFNPLKSPWQTVVWLTHRLLDAPLGFTPLGFTGRNLAQGFS
jgi:hypothetical protein